MKIESNENRESTGFDDNIGIVLGIFTAFFLVLTMGGWLILYDGLKELSKQLDVVRTERIAQIDEVKSIVHELDVKLETVVIKMQRVEELARSNAESAAMHDRQLDNLEKRVTRLRRETREKLRESNTPAQK